MTKPQPTWLTRVTQTFDNTFKNLPTFQLSKNISFYPSFHTFAIKLLIIALAVCWLMNFLQTFSILKILSQNFKPLNFLLFLSLIRLNNIHPHQHDRWTDSVDNQYFFNLPTFLGSKYLGPSLEMFAICLCRNFKYFQTFDCFLFTHLTDRADLFDKINCL